MKYALVNSFRNNNVLKILFIKMHTVNLKQPLTKLDKLQREHGIIKNILLIEKSKKED